MFVSPKSKFLFEIFPCQMPRPEFRVWGLQKKASTKFNGFRLVWSTKWHNANVVIIIIIITTRCKPKPGCSPPGYPPRRLLIIVDWSINWFVCVQRSTCTSCCIQSHASIREMSEGKCPGGMPVPRGSMSVRRCTGVAGSNRRRSTSCITLTTVERVVAECTKSITHWSLWQNIVWIGYTKIGCHSKSLSDRNPILQQSFMPIRPPYKSENVANIGRVLFEKNSNRTNSKNRKQFRQLGSSKVI